MLKRISIKNFALIDDIEIDFHEGLSVITGETGSGKSILLEAIFLLFGKRSDSDFIRHKEERAIVEGDFLLTKTQEEQLDLPSNIKLSRTIERSGRHQIRLNGEIITLSRLKDITSILGLIHGQNDLQAIFDKDEYINFLDQIDSDKIKVLHNNYLLKKTDYENELKKFNTLKQRKDESVEQIDFLTFQIKELESFNLKENELNVLKDNISKLKNFDLIKSTLEFVTSNTSEGSFDLSLLYEINQRLNKLSEVDSSFANLSKTFEDSFYNLDDALKEVNQYLFNLDFDEELFNYYQERSFELERIEKKYKKSINELIIYLEEIKDELLLIKDYDKYIKEAKLKLDDKYNITLKEGLKLRDLRIKNAKVLEQKIVKNLSNLDLPDAEFKVHFEELPEKINFFESGIDIVDFLISFNPGEPIKPIAKVASGGEKARFMFSLKSLFATTKNLNLLVFDEIDIGISGKTAYKVGIEMLNLSKKIQTIVISHLPQVAARANYHYNIKKENINDRITTNIELLDYEKRVLVIAEMLSDSSVSSYAINQAKQLINF